VPRAMQRCSKWPGCKNFRPCTVREHRGSWSTSDRVMPGNWKFLKKATRDRVKAKFGRLACEKCGKDVQVGEVDHILPHSRGGTDDLWNLQILCSGCHRLKTLKERFKR